MINRARVLVYLTMLANSWDQLDVILKIPQSYFRHLLGKEFSI